jgi:serine/threonine protein kinase
MLTAGTKLGRYEIRSQIGAGGMGEVYLAQDAQLDRTVALKVHEVAEEDGHNFNVMQYVAGETLDVQINRKELKPLESISIAVQILNAYSKRNRPRTKRKSVQPWIGLYGPI